MHSPHSESLRYLLAGNGVAVVDRGAGVLDVNGLDAAQIGERTAAAGLVLHELAPREASLEEAFMSLTHDAVEYHPSTTATPMAVPGRIHR